MTATGVNLIPAARRQAKQRQVRVRLWLTGCVVYAALWMAAFVAAQAVVRSEDRALRGELVEGAAKVQETQNKVNALRSAEAGDFQRDRL